jgi:hypothetical protein
VLVDGGSPGHTINDPRFGGLFGFGVVAAHPPDKIIPASFWNWGWEITMRLDAGPTQNFGVCAPVVEITGEDSIRSTCWLACLGVNVMNLKWEYVFGPADQVGCVFTATPHPYAGWFLKEPKFVANGILGYHSLQVTDKTGAALGKPIDLTKKGNPVRSTVQIPNPKRYGYALTTPGKPKLSLVYDLGLGTWTRECDPKQPMSKLQSPAYCLNAGKMWQRTEVPRWGDIDLCGLVFHGWEGGYGAPDCLNCFRGWPAKQVKVRAGVVLGAGKMRFPTVPPAPKPKPPAPVTVRWPNAPWNEGMVLMVAWGLASGQWTSADQVADWAVRGGYKSISFEVTDDNDKWQKAMREACHTRGLGYGIWDLSPYRPEGDSAGSVRKYQPDFYEADWEVVDKQPAAEWAAAFDKDFPNLPRRLCATGGGVPQPADAVPWLANWDLAMQDYYYVNPNATPEGDENFAYWRNFPLNGIGKRHYPVLEVNAEGSGPFADQLAKVDGYRNAQGKLCIATYLAETLTVPDMAASKAAAG